jgi:hypothetical protein
MAPVLAGGVVALMLLTGCQSSDGPVAPETPDEPSASSSATPTVPSTPEPSPASSLGPAANLPVPVKPALADENTPEGLEAFTEYWLELFSYGYETNDWVAFDAVTDPGCRTCTATREAVQAIYAEKGWLSGGRYSLENFGSDFQTNTSGSIQGIVSFRQADVIYFDAAGTPTPEAAPEPSVNVIFAVFEEGRWIMLDFGKPEGS